MARWLLHNALYGTAATHSTLFRGFPFAGVVSVSDGPLGGSTGRVIFYIAAMSQLAADAASDNRASFSVSEATFARGARGPACVEEDPEWPLCARVTLVGTISKLEGADAEGAAELMFARHPHMRSWASMAHKWLLLELRVQHAAVIAYFGGFATVEAAEYYAYKFNSSSKAMGP